MLRCLHLNLDDAWPSGTAGLTTHDARHLGPQMRFSAPSSLIEGFFRDQAAALAPFILYGSGDFHHLSALWIRKITEPLVVVSFDNHPDWDIRPPKWCCGGWVNRALELPHVQKVSVWGCGNFECWWPGQAFGNRRAERAGRLDVHAWADDRPVNKQKRRGAIFRASWRDQFERFVAELAGANVYITIDLDCLVAAEAVTNWENGRFTADDLVWAIGLLRSRAQLVGGDICGAYSEQKYARRGQAFIARIDHPKLSPREPAAARALNLRTLDKLLRALAD
ncbi:MAG: hypothetical protein M3Y80_11585 [Verrucomicrobiota bacterium]|nr:hypothetical protein [Verrucomicrobiota bacterium]